MGKDVGTLYTGIERRCRGAAFPSRAGGGYIFRKYELPEVEAGKVSGRITSFEEKIVLPDSGDWQ